MDWTNNTILEPSLAVHSAWELLQTCLKTSLQISIQVVSFRLNVHTALNLDHEFGRILDRLSALGYTPVWAQTDVENSTHFMIQVACFKVECLALLQSWSDNSAELSIQAISFK